LGACNSIDAPDRYLPATQEIYRYAPGKIRRLNITISRIVGRNIKFMRLSEAFSHDKNIFIGAIGKQHNTISNFTLMKANMNLRTESIQGPDRARKNIH
jgi:hypothetical protein